MIFDGQADRKLDDVVVKQLLFARSILGPWGARGGHVDGCRPA